MCSSLDDLFKGQRYEIQTFEWSGANSAVSRLRAADALSARLDAIRAANPSAKIHLVSHSHGGNVAMYSLRNRRQQQQVASLICLSTPFLHVHPRRMREGVADKVRTSIRVGLVALGLFVTALVMSALGSRGVNPLFALACAPISLLGFIPGQQINRIHDANHRFGERLALPRSLPFPVLILRNTADEASSALGAPQLVSGILSALLRQLIRVQPPLRSSSASSSLDEARLVKLIGVAAGLLGVFVLAFAAYDAAPSIVTRTISLAASILVFGPLLLLSLVPISFLLILVASLTTIPFGPELMRSAISLHITAEASPPGTWSVYQMGGDGSTYLEDQGTQHATHSDPAALSVLASWLREKVLGTADR
ncbi:MAG: hypothetical protein U1F56_17230 [Rubrivivax sp.]